VARACLLAWLVLLAACGGGGGHASGGMESGDRATAGAARAPGSASPLDVLRAGASDPGFARALAVRRFQFPEDHGPHPAYRHEWWYFTGHLRSASGARFGFELTFFRIAVAPPASAAPDSDEPALQSRWRTRQIYVAHFAVTDVERGQFHSAQRFARDALGLAGARATPFRVWLGGWSVAEEGAPGVWTLRVADPAYGLTLELRPLSPPVLNGDRGLSRKSDAPGSASYYYSIPRLAARGRLARGAQAMDVSGTAWLDREWDSGALGPHQQGWDWFGLQLQDGSALMFYSLRDADGARDPHSAGTWIGADGRTSALSSDDVRIDVLAHWRSPRGILYPARWRLRVSSLGLDVDVKPVLADQELDTSPLYWEGDADVSGRRDGQAIAGQAYVELVGYPAR
jgi:predicted secreted hydrolase